MTEIQAIKAKINKQGVKHTYIADKIGLNRYQFSHLINERREYPEAMKRLRAIFKGKK